MASARGDGRREESVGRSTASRVVFVVSLGSARGQYGGPFDVTMRQFALLHGRGVSASVVFGHLRGDRPRAVPLSARIEAVEVRRLLPGSRFSALCSWRMLVALDRAVRRADLVHVSFGREVIPVVAVVLALLRRRPFVLQPHGMLLTAPSPAKTIVDRVLRPILGSARAWLALTADERDGLERAWPGMSGRIRVVGNPPPLDAGEAVELAATARRDEALFLARLARRKRVDLFTAAAAAAEQRDWPEQYVVIGPDEGELEGVLESAAQRRNLVYEGALDPSDVPSRLAQTGVFVLPAEVEPWGNVLAMALQVGVPVVVSRSSALVATIGGLPGVRIFDADDVATLAAAVHESLAVAPLEAGDYPLVGADQYVRDLLDAYRLPPVGAPG